MEQKIKIYLIFSSVGPVICTNLSLAPGFTLIKDKLERSASMLKRVGRVNNVANA